MSNPKEKKTKELAQTLDSVATQKVGERIGRDSKWRKVGKIKTAQGLRGDVWVLVFSGIADWSDRLEECGLASEDLETTPQVNLKKYAVQKVKWHREGLVVKLAGVDDRNHSESLLNQFFYVSSEILVAQKGETLFLAEIEGFQVLQGGETIGTIVGFSSNGPQDLLVVAGPSQTYEIPFVEAFLEKVDFQGKLVRMHLPEGLLEVNSRPAKPRDSDPAEDL